MKRIIERINRRPKPLRIVCWIQLGLIALTFISIIFSILEGMGNDALIAVLGIVFAILTIYGILERSRFIRSLLLVLNWLAIVAAVLYAAILLLAVFYEGQVYLVVALLEYGVSACIAGVTIWGLTKRVSKDYFGIM